MKWEGRHNIKRAVSAPSFLKLVFPPLIQIDALFEKIENCECHRRASFFWSTDIEKKPVCKDELI